MTSTPAPAPEPTHSPPPSVLDRVRANRVGPPAVALGVAISVGLLLSVLVPKQANVLALILLGTIVAAAVGFTVRFLSSRHGLGSQVVAFVSTIIGVHLMSVTGSLNGTGGGRIAGVLPLPQIGWDEALLAALASPLISTGGIIAGLVAALIAGFGPRHHDDCHGHHHHDHGYDHSHDGPVVG